MTGKIWFKSIWVQLMSDPSVFNGSVLIHFSRSGLLEARRVMDTISNFEDKVVFKGVALVGPVKRIAQWIVEVRWQVG